MPVGTVCIAVALPTGSHAVTVHLGTLREQVRQFAVINSLDLLRRRLELGAPPALRSRQDLNLRTAD